MANYSYDYGDAHFLCLDSNVYVDPTNAALQSWIAAIGSIVAFWADPARAISPSGCSR